MKDKDSNAAAMWIPVWIIISGVAGWGIYHIIGALRSGADWSTSLIKSLIILGCVTGFLAFWALALRHKARRDRMESE